MSDRKKPGVAFWATVVISGSSLYALLWGPACWIWHHTPAPDWLKKCLDVIYFPMDWLHWCGPDSLSTPLHWYWDWWV
jgi:hypothetical protein